MFVAAYRADRPPGEMFSYFEQIGCGGVPAGCEPHALAERLMAASKQFGDTADTAGRPDYLVRVALNCDSPLRQFAPALTFDAKSGGIDVVEQHRRAAPETVAHLVYDGPWLDDAERCFKDFRRRLPTSNRP